MSLQTKLWSRGLLDLKVNLDSQDLMVFLVPEDLLGKTVPRELREQMVREETLVPRDQKVMWDHQALLEATDLVGNLEILGKRYTHLFLFLFSLHNTTLPPGTARPFWTTWWTRSRWSSWTARPCWCQGTKGSKGTKGAHAVIILMCIDHGHYTQHLGRSR